MRGCEGEGGPEREHLPLRVIPRAFDGRNVLLDVGTPVGRQPPSVGNIAHGPREAAVRVGHGVGGGRVRISPLDSRCGGSE